MLLKSVPISVVQAADYVLKERCMEDKRFFITVANFFPVSLCYIKTWRRCRLLRELQQLGIDVDIYGSGWEDSTLAQKANMHVHGEIPYKDMLDIIAKAKVIISDEACFNSGAHDRVFTAMLNGTAVVSEYSSYLAEEFSIGDEIFMFGWENIQQELQIVHKLLANDLYREDVARKAYNKVLYRHTWLERAKRMLETVELIKFQSK
jgi:spore maturation protein CgeB